MRILFFQVNRLGDAMVSLPAVQTLRRLRPDWEISVVTGPAESILYQGEVGRDGGVGHALSHASTTVWPEARDRFNNSWMAPWRLYHHWSRVRNFRPDACVLGFDQGNVAHWLARASGAPIRVGSVLPHVKIGGSLTHEVARPENGSAARWSWEMGRTLWTALGAASGWPLDPPCPDLARLFSSANSSRGIVVHAGASSDFTQWPLARFAETATTLAGDFPVTWIDRPETDAVALPPQVTRQKCSTLEQLAEVLSRARFFLGNNSGPMHVANALGLAGLVVSGPTANGWDPFWHREKWAVLRRPDLPCQPCQPTDVPVRTCHHRERPHACLQDWSVPAVVTKVKACIQNLDTNLSAP